MSKGSSTYLLRLPASLKAAVAEISKEEGRSINQFVTMAVAEKIAAMKTAEFFNARRRGRHRGGTPAAAARRGPAAGT